MNQKKKKKKKSSGMMLIAAAALIILCVFLARDGISTLANTFYPRTYQKIVQQYAEEYDVDENIVFAIIRTESNFRPKAESKVGARGLMQITEETFAWIKSKIAKEEALTFDDLYDPQVNIRFGTYLISYCLLRYEGDLSTAAAAYHSGLGLVDGLVQNPKYSQNGKTLTEFPYEQMNLYVYKVNKNYKRYLALYAQDEGV